MARTYHDAHGPGHRSFNEFQLALEQNASVPKLRLGLKRDLLLAVVILSKSCELVEEAASHSDCEVLSLEFIPFHEPSYRLLSTRLTRLEGVIESGCLRSWGRRGFLLRAGWIFSRWQVLT